MNIPILIFILIPTSNAFCEAYWRSNISTSYGSSENLSEPVNAISSLTYTMFGLVGIFMKNYTNMYYLLMNMFIILGLSSFFHHYYYYDAAWAYAADLICTYFLSCFSLFYIICDNEYFKYKIINKLCSLLIITNYISILVCYKIGFSNVILIKTIIYGIIASQSIICIYFLIIKSSIKYRILISSLWNFGLGTTGYNLWLYDIECTNWAQHTQFNGHMIWHITIAWTLFNTLNVTNVCRYTFNEIKFTWKPLIKCAPWFLYVIVLSKEKSNITDNYTNIEVGEIKHLLDKTKNHRRVNTYG